MSTQIFTINAFTALVYFGLFALQLQSMSAGIYGVSFIFLPHGWRVLSFFLFRFSAMPGLFTGHLLTCLVFYGSVSDNWPLYLVTSLQGAYTLPLIYLVLTLCGVDLLKSGRTILLYLDFDSLFDRICHPLQRPLTRDSKLCVF